MSLFITYENNSVSEHWIPFNNINVSEGSHVKQINVDGEELEYVRHRFNNIPFTTAHRKIMRYYGDTAKFIVGNLI